MRNVRPQYPKIILDIFFQRSGKPKSTVSPRLHVVQQVEIIAQMPALSTYPVEITNERVVKNAVFVRRTVNANRRLTSWPCYRVSNVDSARESIISPGEEQDTDTSEQTAFMFYLKTTPLTFQSKKELYIRWQRNRDDALQQMIQWIAYNCSWPNGRNSRPQVVTVPFYSGNI